MKLVVYSIFLSALSLNQISASSAIEDAQARIKIIENCVQMEQLAKRAPSPKPLMGYIKEIKAAAHNGNGERSLEYTLRFFEALLVQLKQSSGAHPQLIAFAERIIYDIRNATQAA